MIQRTFYIILALFLSANLAVAKPETEVGGIAAVNLEYVLQNALAVKDLQQKAEAIQAKQVKSVEQEDKKLQDREKDLLKKRDSLNPQAFEEKVMEFQRDVDAFQRKNQELSVKLTESFNQSLSKIQGIITEIVAGMAKERHYLAVLSQSETLYVQPSIDITEAVLEALNKRIKTAELYIKK